MTYQISSAIRYLDGPLAGLEIPDGYSLRVGSIRRAVYIANWINKTRASKDFVRAAVTGNRYQFINTPEIVAIAEEVR